MLAEFAGLVIFTSQVRAAECDRCGSLRVAVVDASSHVPLAFAGVEVHGGVDRRGVTNAAGVVLFRGLPPGSYAVTLTARRYLPSGLRAVIVAAGVQRALRLSLHLLPPSLQRGVTSAPLGTIAYVRPKAGAPQARTGVVSDSSIPTRVSGSILTSLGMLPGVVLQSSDGNIGASVGGRSTAQTQTSIDGVPVIGPAQGLGMFGSGIFSSASADLASSSLSFTTPDPTLDWLGRLSQIEGGYGLAQTTIGESGTADRLGMSLAYSRVARASPLDGMRYLDASGLDYVHDGLSTGDAFAAKLRYPTSRSNVLFLIYDTLRQSTPVLCDIFTATVPCGYGPGDRDLSIYDVAQIRDSWSGPLVDGSASFFSSANATTSEADSRSDFERSLSNGIAFNGTIHITPSYGVKATWQSIGTRSDSRLSGSGGPIAAYQFPTSHTSSFSLDVPLTQSRRIATSLDLTENSQLGRAASGLNVVLAYRPTNRDTISVRYGANLSSRPTVYRSEISPASALAFDCTDHTALGSGPSALGSDVRTSQVGVTWTRSGDRVTSEISLTHAVDRDGLVDAIVAAPVLDPDLFGPTFGADIAAAGDRACGAGSGFTANDALFRITGIASRAIYDGVQAAAQIKVGPNIITGLLAGVTSARAFGTASPVFSTRSTVIQGRQLPGRPFADASWSLAYGSGRGMLLLFDAHYVSRNNPNALPAYTTFDASAMVPTAHGGVSVALLNLTNVHPGPFATSAGAVSLPMLVGSYRPPAQPLPPRTFEVRYQVQVGKNPESLEAMLAYRGRYLPYDSPIRSDALGIDRQSPLCGPELVPDMQALLGAVGSYTESVRAAFTGGERPSAYPDGAFHGVRLIYRRSGRSFVVLIARMPTASRVSIRAIQTEILSCATFRTGTLAQARLAGLYVPSWQERTTQGLIFGFAPTLGFYEIPPLIDEAPVHYLPLSDRPPADPFGLSQDPGCTDEVRPAAAAFLQALEKFATAYYRGKSALPEAGLSIEAHPGADRGWLQVRNDGGFLDPLMPCLILHSGGISDFARIGIPMQPPGSIDYSPALGLYTFI